jgi:hypothetical protein
MKWAAVLFCLCGLAWADDGSQRAQRAGKSLLGQPGPAAVVAVNTGYSETEADVRASRRNTSCTCRW